tara:strand:- start:481 stop:720 length:240 start_codon:yes stop_codon:yes gene_type:complete
MITYEIDQDGTLWISIKGAEVPFLKQAAWPDGMAWGKGEADAWAKQFVIASGDPEQEVPGDNPLAPTKPRYVAPFDKTI